MGVAKPMLGALATASLLCTASSSSAQVGRALPDNPSGGYAPARVNCPASLPTIRSAARVSPNETEWLASRRPNTVAPMTAFLERVNISGFDVADFMASAGSDSSLLPNIGIAVSGGGYRALMNGAGFIAAADSRVAGSNGTGGIGGLLQSATYLSALSGGGWLVGSIYANNFSTVPDLQAGSPETGLWAFDRNILEGPSAPGVSLLSTVDYWENISSDVNAKKAAGFNISITDYWGRALSFQLINAAQGGPAYTFSSIARTPGFGDAQQPLPILVSDERSPGTNIVSLNSTVFEFNPWEMGSWDPTLFGFAPLEYIGSNFADGSVSSAAGQQCVRGFDQFGFVMGTSSSLFNALLVSGIADINVPSELSTALTSIANSLSESNEDIAQYAPNPFFHYNSASNPSALSADLTLVDGGEDLQNIPLVPLIQPERALDVVFAVDSSADTTNNWPNATALRATYQRSLAPISNGTQFPAIPSAETFINLGLNRRPTAFGCNTNSSTSADYPLIVYIPNTPYTALSNVSTLDLQYSDAQRNEIIQNGYNVATMGNGTLEASWPTCVGCLILQRSLVRSSRAIPTACQSCYTSFCYNGTVDDTSVASFEPTPFLQLANTTEDLTSGSQTNIAGRIGEGARGVAVLTWVTMLSALIASL